MPVMWMILVLGCKAEPPAEPAPPEPTVAEAADAAIADAAPMTFGVEEEHRGAIRKPLLWRVDGPSEPSWLFGTMHGGVRATWKDLPPPVRRAMQTSDTVVFETDTRGVDPAMLAPFLTLPPGKSLRAGIGDERFEKLVEFTGHPREVLDRYRPWVVHGELVSRWIGDEQPVDTWMLEHAQKRGKRLDYLETMQKQVEMLDSAITFDVLQRTLDDLDEQERLLTRAVQVYKDGDDVELRRKLFAAEDVAAYQSMYDALFKKRNRRWLPEIVQHVKRGKTLFVVGAGHLIGPDDLVGMLREEGYRVDRM